MSWDSWWALELDSRPSTDLTLRDQIRSYYDALWHANVTVDFRSPDDDLSPYRLVVVPNLYLVRSDQAASITRYVEQGGHVVMSFFSGIVDEDDGIHLGGYPAPFREMLGIRVEEFWPLRAGESVEVEFVDGPAGMAKCWSEMVYTDDADVVAQFGSGDLWGQPAATRHGAGKGSATYLATRLDGALMRHVMSTACTHAGVAPVLPAAPLGVEAVRRGDSLFLLNHTSEAIEVGLPGPGTNLITGKHHESTVLVAPRGVAAVVPTPS
jgi:beta-galactosidase